MRKCNHEFKPKMIKLGRLIYECIWCGKEKERKNDKRRIGRL